MDEAHRMCRVCGTIDSHTLPHYVLHCPPLQRFRNDTIDRNDSIDSVTQQIIWMTNNKKIDEIVKTFIKNFAPRV